MKKYTFSLVLFLCLVGIAAISQQTRIITGQINDDSDLGGGFPLPGANIIIKGTTQGTSTDIDGRFVLEVPVGATIEISSVGLKTREITIGPNDGYDPKEFKSNASSHTTYTDTSIASTEKGIVKKVETTTFYHHDIPNDPSRTFSPYFFIHSREPKVDRMPLKQSHADLHIAGIIADVTITQTYINEGETTLEAEYIFPGSTSAAVYNMNMQIGQRTLKAVIKKKNEAKKIYETAKAEGKTASLLDQERPNVFKMSVANILPKDTILVTISYTELLNAHKGIYSFIYPTVVAPRFANDEFANIHNSRPSWTSNPFAQDITNSEDIDFSMDITMSSPIPLQKINSSSHKITADFNSPTDAYIRLDNDEGHEGNRDFILNYSFRDEEVQSGLITYQDDKENFFAYVMEPPATITEDKLALREYVFLLDATKSMNGESMKIANKVMQTILNNLKPYERFNIFFMKDYNYWLSGTPLFATEKNKKRALGNLYNNDATENTQMLSALKQAFESKKTPFYSRSFIVISDGLVTVDDQAYSYVRDNIDKTNLVAVGVGPSANRHFINGLAHAGQTDPFFVTNFYNAQFEAQNIADAIKHPVLTDIELTVEGVEIYDMEPVKIPDLFANRSIIVYGKYKNNTGGKITLSGLSGENTYEKTAYFDTKNSAQNKALKYLWARNKIKYYDDYAGYYEPDDFQKQGVITELGLQYNLLTKYTSFVAVDTAVRALQPKTATENLRKKDMLKVPSKPRVRVEQPLPIPKNSTSANTNMSFSLQEDAVAIDECVAVGYGVQREEDLSISATVVGADEFMDKPVLGVSQSLQGKAAGVQVTANSGSVGSSCTVRIRGTSAIGNYEPLYVIDGIPTSGIPQISPQNIEAISILKDASATSLYGSRGANGVVVITTKIDRKFSHYKNKYLEYESTYSLQEPIHTALNTNNFNKASSFNNSLQFSQSNQKSHTKLYGTYSLQEGILPKSNGTAYTASFNTTRKIKKRLKIQLNSHYDNTENNNLLDNFLLSNNIRTIQLNENHEIENTFKNEENFNVLGKIEYKIGNFITLAYQQSYSNSETSWGIADLQSSTEKYINIRKNPSLVIDKKIYSPDSSEIDFSLSMLTNLLYDNENISFHNTVTDTANYNRLSKYFSEHITITLGQKIALTARFGLKNLHSTNHFDNSYSIAYKLHNTDFFKNRRIFRNINEFKMRGSISTNYTEKSLSNIYSLYGNPLPYSSGNTHLVNIENIGNLALIKKEQKGLGVDIAFWKNKFLLTFDMYEQYLTNNVAPVAQTNGFAYTNAYDSRNKGFEASANFRRLEGRFHYSLKTSFTQMQTDITNVYNGDSLLIAAFHDVQILAKEGEPYGQIYSTKTNICLGNINPNFELGTQITMDFRGFDMSMNIIYKDGGKILNYTNSYIEKGSLESVSASDALADNTSLSLKEISLGYTIPNNISRALKIKKCRISAFAHNAYIVAKKSKLNLEGNINSRTNGYGIDFFGTPMQRIMGGKLTIKF